MGLWGESIPEFLRILRERISQELGILEEEWKIVFAHAGTTEFAKKYSASSEKVSFQEDKRKNHIMCCRKSFHIRAGLTG